MLFGINTRSHGARNGVAGASGALQGFVCYNLPQGVLLLYLEDVWLFSLVLTDAKIKREDMLGLAYSAVLPVFLHAE